MTPLTADQRIDAAIAGNVAIFYNMTAARASKRDSYAFTLPGEPAPTTVNVPATDPRNETLQKICFM